MTEITAQMVKSLRERTGAGMMDCKKALQEADGSEEQAVEIIQKKGLAKVAKKAGAIAAEGVVHAYIHPGSRLGVLVEINCQTDFVARNDEFKAFVEGVGLHRGAHRPALVQHRLREVCGRRSHLRAASLRAGKRRTLLRQRGGLIKALRGAREERLELRHGQIDLEPGTNLRGSHRAAERLLELENGTDEQVARPRGRARLSILR